METKFDPGKCVNCKICTAEPVCPMKAITYDGDQVKRDNERCFNCGLCTTQCVGGAFQGSLGAINFDGRKIPVILRQSDRSRAIRLADELKRQILNGSFKMTRMWSVYE